MVARSSTRFTGRFDIRTGKVIGRANWPAGVLNVLCAVRGEKPLQTWPVRVTRNQVQVDIG